MNLRSTFLKSYGFSLVLLLFIAVGSALGLILGKDAERLKPLGDVFLNLLFTAVVPLVFFSISSAVAGMGNVRRLSRILLYMIGVFAATGFVASVLMVIGVSIFPPASGSGVRLPAEVAAQPLNTVEQIVRTFTAPDFVDVLSKKNMMPLIVFSLLVGLATCMIGEKGKVFAAFLASANDVMMKLISLIMLYAPIGLGAYFAYLVGVFGPDLLGAYARAMALYYPLTFAYFLAGFSFYAWLAGRMRGVKTFWSNIIPASLTALATGSSMATIPSNIQAADRIGVPRDISEVVIPIGATIHMDGSCLAAVLKIAFIFGLLGRDFSGFDTWATAVGVSMLAGTVVSGIPGGGLIGELLIITLYGLPIQALPILTMIGTLVDPPATMVNAIGDNVASMIIARILGGRKWMDPPAPAA